MTNSFVFTNFFLDTSTFPLYLLFHQFQHRIDNPARPAAVRDAKWHTDAKRQTPPRLKMKRRARRKGLTPQQISEINRQNAMRRWYPAGANSHPGDANSHDANPHITSRARSSSFCIEIESEVEKEKEAPADPILIPQDPPSLVPQAHHSRQKNLPRSRGRAENRANKLWNGDWAVKRAKGAEQLCIEQMGDWYQAVKARFLARYPMPRGYFWSYEDAFAVQALKARRETMTVEDFDAQLVNYHGSEGIDRAAPATVVLPMLQMFSAGPIEKKLQNKPFYRTQYNPAAVGTWNGKPSEEVQVCEVDLAAIKYFKDKEQKRASVGGV